LLRRELKEDLDRIVETIIYLMTESRRLSKDEAQRLGVTATQLSVLKLLDEIGDLSLGTLSTKIRAHNSTVTGIIDRMEAAGLVTRARSLEDRRVWIIQLLPEGRRIAERASVSPWDTLRAALEKMAPKEQDQLTQLLKKVSMRVQDEISSGEDKKPRQPKKENHGTRR
jgi:MarR family transcriptional regulator, organic hydroperoxide resistance regulator